jgi:chloride channel protein, CIC family
MAPDTLASSPVAGSAAAPLPGAQGPPDDTIPQGLADRRVVYMSGWAVAVGVTTGFVAQGLVRLIVFVTNLAFYGRLSFEPASPAGHHLGAFVVAVPVVGGLVVGVMARYGSEAIRGHGIPEAMEQVLVNQSRIPPRVALLKPLSAAISIGTGGPFGAEGPIIATGGALGSLVGQLLRTTAAERKTLLAAGAAAGMAATFGSPVSAVLLAVELLLFELRPRSIVPVALSSAAATAVRMALVGNSPMFAMPLLARPRGAALAAYVLMGAVVGVLSVCVTRAIYLVEDTFDRLPIHWMWWPALGAVAVGLVGLVSPRTLGVGYENIEQLVQGRMLGAALLSLGLWKFVSWSVSLGSGTSGGTLAPLFTIGGAFGGLLGSAINVLAPGLGVDPRISALVGMAAIFAGASRALLASVVFAFETTLQPLGLLPLLGGCTAAFLVSCLLMRNTIMTEKIARRGILVPSEYLADYLAQILVREACSRRVVALAQNDSLEHVRRWMGSGAPGAHHQGFPVLDARERLVGLVSRRSILDPANAMTREVREIMRLQPPAILEDRTLRDAADQMVRQRAGRLPVVSRANDGTMVGIISRSDVLGAHRRRLEDLQTVERCIEIVRFPRGTQV